MKRITRWFDMDVVYMRWMHEGRVVRVARVTGGECTALYPASHKDRFSLEAFSQVDESVMRVPKMSRDEVKDEVFLRLLSGESIREILRDYQPTPLGEE